MIGQYLPNNNETATVAFRQKFCQLNSPLVAPILPKFHYAKRRFPVTSKCRQMHGVLNIDEIKN
jgi:hypothetical protein